MLRVLTKHAAAMHLGQTVISPLINATLACKECICHMASFCTKIIGIRFFDYAFFCISNVMYSKTVAWHQTRICNFYNNVYVDTIYYIQHRDGVINEINCCKIQTCFLIHPTVLFSICVFGTVCIACNVSCVSNAIVWPDRNGLNCSEQRPIWNSK